MVAFQKSVRFFNHPIYAHCMDDYTCHVSDSVILCIDCLFVTVETGTSMNPCSDIYGGSEAFSEPETDAIKTFLSNVSTQTQIKAYLSLHAYGQYWLYSWGYTRQLPEDHQLLVNILKDGHFLSIPHLWPLNLCSTTASRSCTACTRISTSTLRIPEYGPNSSCDCPYSAQCNKCSCFLFQQFYLQPTIFTAVRKKHMQS